MLIIFNTPQWFFLLIQAWCVDRSTTTWDGLGGCFENGTLKPTICYVDWDGA